MSYVNCYVICTYEIDMNTSACKIIVTWLNMNLNDYMYLFLVYPPCFRRHFELTHGLSCALLTIVMTREI